MIRAGACCVEFLLVAHSKVLTWIQFHSNERLLVIYKGVEKARVFVTVEHLISRQELA